MSNFIQEERAELKRLFGYWKTLSGVLTWVFALLPIGGAFVDDLLPGELRFFAPALAVALCIVVVLFLYFVYRGRTLPEIECCAMVFFGVAVIFLAVFVFSWFTWVVEVDKTQHIMGMYLTVEATEAIRQAIPEDPISLLNRFGHDSEDRIWRLRNVVKVILVFSFAGFFALISGSFFLFTLRLLPQVSTSGSRK